MKRTPLKVDPERVRAWQQRSRKALAAKAKAVRGKRKQRRRKQRRPAIGTALTTLVAKHGRCELKDRAPGPCWGGLEVHHRRARGMGRARGDWVKCLDGSVMGNLNLLCTGHHRWAQEHMRESQDLLFERAEAWGALAEAMGIEPQLYEGPNQGEA